MGTHRQGSWSGLRHQGRLLPSDSRMRTEGWVGIGLAKTVGVVGGKPCLFKQLSKAHFGGTGREKLKGRWGGGGGRACHTAIWKDLS